MNRRGFIGALAAAALDPERVLWIPGRRLISIPAPRPASGVAIARAYRDAGHVYYSYPALVRYSVRLDPSVWGLQEHINCSISMELEGAAVAQTLTRTLK